MAAELRKAGIAAIFALDQLRAAQTAAIAARVLGLPPAVLDPCLRERGMGPSQCVTYGEATARTGRSLDAAGWVELAGLPGVEDDDTVPARLLAAFADIAAGIPGGRALAASHGSAMAALVRGLPGARAPVLGNGAVLRLRGAATDWRMA